jgi:hypothetical protein
VKTGLSLDQPATPGFGPDLGHFEGLDSRFQGVPLPRPITRGRKLVELDVLWQHGYTDHIHYFITRDRLTGTALPTGAPS